VGMPFLYLRPASLHSWRGFLFAGAMILWQKVSVWNFSVVEANNSQIWQIIQIHLIRQTLSAFSTQLDFLYELVKIHYFVGVRVEVSLIQIW
jgi:hypothetical protein